MKKLFVIIMLGMCALTACEIEIPALPDYSNTDTEEDSSSSDNNTYSGISNKDRNDFTFHMYLEKFYASSNASGKGYSYMLDLGFGHENGIWYDDITEFGIEIRALNGTITNKSGWNDDYVKVTKSNGWTYFNTGENGTMKNETWSTSVFVDSSYTAIEIEWRPKWYDDHNNTYMTSNKTNTKTFTLE